MFVRNTLYKLCGQKDQVTIEEINLQPDHIHLIISIPPKYSVSEIMGFLKGKTALNCSKNSATSRSSTGEDTCGREAIAYPPSA